MLSILIPSLVFLVVALPVWLMYRKRALRQTTLARMLDLADDVERLLNRSQERMAALRPLVQRVPADIAAEAQASLESSLPIREAKRDVLQHRLWIQKHGDSARQQELDQACAALARVRETSMGNLRNWKTSAAIWPTPPMPQPKPHCANRQRCAGHRAAEC